MPDTRGTSPTGLRTGSPRPRKLGAVLRKGDGPPGLRALTVDGEVMELEQVYRDQFRFVWRVLHGMGVPDRDVPDAVQDVFMVVHRKLAEFEGRSALRSWIYGICLRVASNRRKSAFTRRERLEPLDLETPTGDPSPSQQAETRQLTEVAALILERVPEEQRAVFVLFEMEGMVSEDIAELLEIPLGTVYSRLRRAREAFRREVQRLGARERFRGAVGGEI